ncbi:MAG: GTPase HflX [Clostridiales bacterium]|nr:GTPase HflX [Clostridiales bacterium]
MIETKEQREKVLLVAVDLEDGTDVASSLDELAELADTAGADTVGRLIQNREAIHAATYIGKGKIQELKELVWQTEADTVICDDELSPAQIGNLQEALDCKVIDRTVLILDIFAAHASTSEGKLQVELAQLRYRASRLTGLGKSLSRIGGSAAGSSGGIGTRGPGEKKLEMDRRLIRERISMLNRQLKNVVATRETMRKQRLNNGTKVVAIVGYTNAGKSTLLNALTHSDVLEEDMLFATLDPTTRSYEMENGQKILFTDTVGFINKLPHHLIQAFRSTLEEAKYADMILHVVDCSDENYEIHMDVVYDTLKHLDVKDKPVLTVFNKIDRLRDTTTSDNILKDCRSKDTVKISAKQRLGFEELLQKTEKILNEDFVRIEKTFSYEEAGKIQLIRQYGRLDTEEYREDGIYVEAAVPTEYVGKVMG